MEKYGVECGCASNRDPRFMTKTASGEDKCSKCGRTYETVKVSEKLGVTDEVKVEEKKEEK